MARAAAGVAGATPDRPAKSLRPMLVGGGTAGGLGDFDPAHGAKARAAEFVEDSLGDNLGRGKGVGKIGGRVQVAMLPAVEDLSKLPLGDVEVDHHGVFIERVAGEFGSDAPVVPVRWFQRAVR